MGLGLQRFNHIGTLLNQIPQEYTDYAARVVADGGTVTDETLTSDYIKFLKSKLLYDISLAILSANGGSLKRLLTGSNYLVKLYDFAKHETELGSELVTTGAWINGAGFTTSGGELNVNSAYAFTSQDIIEIGEIYEVTYTVDRTSGSIVALLGNTKLTVRSASGTYTERKLASYTNRDNFSFYSGDGFVGKLGNISVKKILRNDVYQSITASQPIFLQSDESYLINPQLTNLFIKHNPVSFLHGTAWTATVVFDWNGSAATNADLIGNRESASMNRIFLRQGSTNNLRFINRTAFDTTCVFLQDTSVLVGKLAILHVYATESGGLGYFVNGRKIEEKSIANTGIIFSTLFDGPANEGYFEGKKKIYRLQSGAISEANALNEANHLLSKYEKVPTATLSGINISTLNTEIICSKIGTLIPDGTVTGTWTGGTSFWCYHSDSNKSWGKLYNKAARDVIVVNPPIGYHVATETELTAMSLLGGTAIKTALNLSTLTASRNADGSFNTWGATASIWCADSDKVLLLDTTNSATIGAATANQGHSIRLVKNVESTIGAILIGDSTTAVFSGQNKVGYYLLTAAERLTGAYDYSIATVGHKIADQKTKYLQSIDKELCNYTIIMVGLNDILAATSSATIVAALQDLVNTINSNKKTGSKVIIATLTPCKAALSAVSGAYTVWLAVNTAIRTTITGIDAVVDSHTASLGDGADNLGAAYQLDVPDNLHENNAGREIIAAAWRVSIDSF